MTDPHPRRKLTDDQIRALLAREMNGERRADLAAEASISIPTLGKHARRLGLRKCDTGAPDLRCRPEGGWPEDQPLPQSRVGMSPADWRRCLERYIAGEPDVALAEEYGVSTGAIHNQAGAMKMCKRHRPDAVYRTSRPPVWPARPEALRGNDPLDDDQPGPPLKLHAAQQPPGGDWRTWLFLGGRGAGKTLAGAEWLADQVELLGEGGRVALIGPTLHDVREVMIEGVSGLRSLPRWTRRTRPVYQPSRRRLYFANGAVAYAFSAEDPDSLRGPQFSAAWADELCAWPAHGARGAAETLAMLRMGLRLPLRAAVVDPSGSPDPTRPGASRALTVSSPSRSDGEGDHPQPQAKDGGGGDTGAQAASDRVASDSAPRLCVTTTPKPSRALVRLKDEPTCVHTHAPTAVNAANLSPGFIDDLKALYGGTRREAQELDGRIVDLDGALFTAEMMLAAREVEPASPSPEVGRDVGEADRVGNAAARTAPPQKGRETSAILPPRGRGTMRSMVEGAPSPSPYDRIIVALDPPATATGDACGLIAAGRRTRPDGATEAVILADRTKSGLSPDQWARRAQAMAHEFGAAAIVAEVNQGGDMVKSVLRAAGVQIQVLPVRASTSKRARAEPVAALYEQGRVKHLGDLSALEEELMLLGGEMEDTSSLDRADALVWAVTHLLVERRGEGPWVRRV